MTLLNDQTGRNARRRARRGQRGATLVEAAFMLPMFIILFYSSLYAHNLSYGYIQENRLSRLNAWQYAMANCGNAQTISAGGDSEQLPPSDPGSGSGAATKVSPLAMKDGQPPPGGTGTGSDPLTGLDGTIASGLASVFPNPDGATSTNTLNLSWRLPNLYKGGGLLGSSDGSNTTTITQVMTVPCNNPPNTGGAFNAAKMAIVDIGSLLTH